MLAVGNDELGQSVKKGDQVINDKGMTGTVKYGTDADTGEETDIMGFIKVETDLYLVAIAGKLFGEWRIKK